MKPRYYVHMGPRAAEKVSSLWKVTHIFLFFLILCSSSIATACIYNILDMYKFNCLIYAKVSFEETYAERIKHFNNQTSTPATVSNATNSSTASESVKQRRSVDCDSNSAAEGCGPSRNGTKPQSRFIGFHQKMAFFRNILKKLKTTFKQDAPYHHGRFTNLTVFLINDPNRKGYMNMRKTIFATLYMCDLMLFSPLISIIVAVFTGALLTVSGKGGAGNPGDLLPNPWICVYPFLGVCAFMTVLSFISDNLFHKGLAAFCSHYQPLTKSRGCSEAMDIYNVQFSADQRGPPRPFYMTYFIGSIGVQLTSGLWVLQTILYIFRILCMADFSLYLTRIRLKDDDKTDPKLGNIVVKMMDRKSKAV